MRQAFRQRVILSLERLSSADGFELAAEHPYEILVGISRFQGASMRFGDSKSVVATLLMGAQAQGVLTEPWTNT